MAALWNYCFPMIGTESPKIFQVRLGIYFRQHTLFRTMIPLEVGFLPEMFLWNVLTGAAILLLNTREAAKKHLTARMNWMKLLSIQIESIDKFKKPLQNPKIG